MVYRSKLHCSKSVVCPTDMTDLVFVDLTEILVNY
jgi:hypothetical protein